MLKKLEAKNMQVVYEYPLFKLIRVSDNDKTNLKPLILINGQMEHHIQAIETATNITKSGCYQYSGYYLYDDEIHTPYIFVYDYPIYFLNRKTVTNEAFAYGLINALKSLKLGDVDILGESNGGMIAILASTSELVDKVIALHSPIYGSPCLEISEYEKMLKSLNLTEKILFRIIKLITDPQFGYMALNKKGFDNIAKISDLNKILITTSSLIKKSSNNMLANKLAYMHYNYLEKETDGIITFDLDRLNSDGINYELETGISHFSINSYKYTSKYYSYLTRKK